jgi:hypothetical protein
LRGYRPKQAHCRALSRHNHGQHISPTPQVPRRCPLGHR